MRRIAFVAFAVVHLAMLAGGIVYATTPRMLSYHEQALGLTWAELTPGFQALYLTMCRALGVATVIAALALLALLVSSWRRSEEWAWVLVPVLTLGYGLPLLAITIWVRIETGAQTPIGALVVGCLIALFATALSFRRPHRLRGTGTKVLHS